jgi:hypothetical protein
LVAILTVRNSETIRDMTMTELLDLPLAGAHL